MFTKNLFVIIWVVIMLVLLPNLGTSDVRLSDKNLANKKDIFHQESYIEDSIQNHETQINLFSNDVGVEIINWPPDGSKLKGEVSSRINATVKNYGTDAQLPGIPVKLKISGPNAYLYEDTEITKNELNTNSTELIRFEPDWQVPNTDWTYTIEIQTTLAGDENSSNDQKTINITAEQVPLNDVGVTAIEKPSSGSRIKGKTNLSIKAEISNLGANKQSQGILVKLKITSSEGYLYEDEEVTKDTLVASQIKELTFTNTWLVPNYEQTYKFEIWTEFAGDEDPSNDKQSIDVTAYKVDSLKVCLLGHVPIYGDCRGLSISGSYAYSTDGGGVYSADISDPANPQIKDVLDIDTITHGTDVHVVGNYAYVSEEWWSWLHGHGRLRVVDISDPANMIEVGRTEMLADYARDLYVCGEWAFLALDDAGFAIASISDPTSPGKEYNRIDLSDTAWGVFALGNYVYVSSDKYLRIYDFSNAPDLTEMGKAQVLGNGSGVYVTGNYAYVADYQYGLRIINVSDVNNPYLVSTYDTPGSARNVFVANDLAYIADGFFGLRVIDVSNPENPFEVGYYVFPEIDSLSHGYEAGFLDVKLAGDYIYASASNNHGLYVMQYGDVTPVPTTFVTHNTGNLQVSIFENGNISHLAGLPEGDGVTFNGGIDALFSSGFILGTATRRSVNGHLGSFSINDDFVNTVSISDFSASPPRWDQMATATFNDNGAPNPYGITVNQTSYSNTGENSIVICYRLSANNSPINDLYMGLFADWDVGGDAFNSNLGGYDVARNIAYQYVSDGTNDSNYYGVVALDGMSGARVTSAWVPDTPRQSSFQWISTFENESITEPTDYRMWIGSGPFKLLLNDTLSVGFAIVAGTDLNDLIASADVAIQKYKLFTSVEEKTDISATLKTFSLKQNYPNPFNPVTTIQYVVPKPSHVVIELFNTLGQRVKTFVDENKQAGVHSIHVNAITLPSGIYIYRMKAGNFIQSRKMILMQ